MDESKKTELVKAIGRAIAARRNEVGLSQEAIAEALGISREAVSRIETGASTPSVIRLAELADLLSCELGALLAGASNRRLDQAQHMAELLDGVSVAQREILVSVINQIISGFKVK